MAKLTFNTGLKPYEVYDSDGTYIGTIRFNPKDIGIISRLEETMKSMREKLNGLGNEDFTSDVINALDEEFAASVNKAFGSNVCSTILAGQSAFGLCEDGTPVFQAVLQQLIEIVAEESGKAMKRSRAIMESHTADYLADNTIGLAPGQQA